MPQDRDRARAAGSVQSLVRGLDILFRVSEGVTPVSPAELAAELELPRPTVYRLVDTLMSAGLLAREGRGLVPTPRLLMLGGTNRATLGVQNVAEPHLQSLLASVGETVGLHVRAGDHRRCVAEIESHHGIRWARGIGFTAPVWSGAVGHVILAGIPEPAREELYQRIELHPLAANSVRSLDELRERVALVLDRGWGASQSETVDGAAATAAPIYDDRGTIAVISLYAPADRFDVLLDHVDDLLRAAGDVSRDWTAVAPGAGSRRAAGGATGPTAAAVDPPERERTRK